jgi:hypothetical protein
MMVAQIRHRLLLFAFVGLLFPLSACSKLVLSNDYTLGSGQVVDGDLWVPTGNVRIQTSSRVTGSIYQLCCNLYVNGRVNNNIFMLTGNLRLGSEAIVRGGAVVFSGNMERLPGASLGDVSPNAGKRLLVGFFGLFCVLPLAILVLLALLLIGLRRGRARNLPSASYRN